ncbi:hypothetical protein A3715_10415 [Oleiphilus sp. HI0009]|nr:hypothetical protein A3715_10415 [Oleiphilus sp. HI0009]
MSWDFYEQTEPVARKDYRCDATGYLYEVINEGYFSFSDYRLIVKAKRDRWKIKKGQKYIKVVGKWDGEFCTFRARPEMHALCEKHNLYYE